MAAPMPVPDPYVQRAYLSESLDPIHIGTGEFQLGRVDNPIVRERGTNLPKIPGSSIGGVARAFSALHYKRYRWGTNASCAGKGGPNGDKHCGYQDCRICTAYGFSIGQRSFQGLAQFSDASILFFPVYSATGPLWVTSPGALARAGFTASTPLLEGDEADSVVVFDTGIRDPVSLGWLCLPRKLAPQGAKCAEWSIHSGRTRKKLSEFTLLKPVLERLVVVSDRRFPTIVEDQLEVRTSVSISPETGAAESGALFTAEAIPRACFLFSQITFLRPEYFRVPGANGGEEIRYKGKLAEVEDVEETVAAGLRMIEYLGIGGVNTRGIGRLRVIF